MVTLQPVEESWWLCLLCARWLSVKCEWWEWWSRWGLCSWCEWWRCTGATSLAQKSWSFDALSDPSASSMIDSSWYPGDWHGRVGSLVSLRWCGSLSKSIASGWLESFAGLLCWWWWSRWAEDMDWWAILAGASLRLIYLWNFSSSSLTALRLAAISTDPATMNTELMANKACALFLFQMDVLDCGSFQYGCFRLVYVDTSPLVSKSKPMNKKMMPTCNVVTPPITFWWRVVWELKPSKLVVLPSPLSDRTRWSDWWLERRALARTASFRLRRWRPMAMAEWTAFMLFRFYFPTDWAEDKDFLARFRFGTPHYWHQEKIVKLLLTLEVSTNNLYGFLQSLITCSQ